MVNSHDFAYDGETASGDLFWAWILTAGAKIPYMAIKHTKKRRTYDCMNDNTTWWVISWVACCGDDKMDFSFFCMTVGGLPSWSKSFLQLLFFLFLFSSCVENDNCWPGLCSVSLAHTCNFIVVLNHGYELFLPIEVSIIFGGWDIISNRVWQIRSMTDKEVYSNQTGRDLL